MGDFNYSTYVYDLKHPFVGVVAYNHSRYLDVLKSLAESTEDYTMRRGGVSEFDNIKVFFVNSPDTLKGMGNYKLYWHDDWYRRDDIDDIKNADRPNQWREGRNPPYDKPS